MDLKTALAEIDKLKEENLKLREEAIELKSEKMKMEEDWENEAATYTEINQSYETINAELKRMKTKFEVSCLESFIELYGSVAERCDIRGMQHKFFEITGIKYSFAQLKRELEQIGYQVKYYGRKGISYYVSKNVGGYLYIVQLNSIKEQISIK